MPLVLGRIPLHDLDGLRTQKTRSLPEIWHKVNCIGGINRIVATFPSLIVWAVLSLLPPCGMRYSNDPAMIAGLVLMSVVVTLLQVRGL